MGKTMKKNTEMAYGYKKPKAKSKKESDNAKG